MSLALWIPIGIGDRHRPPRGTGQSPLGGPPETSSAQVPQWPQLEIRCPGRLRKGLGMWSFFCIVLVLVQGYYLPPQISKACHLIFKYKSACAE